MIKRYLQKKIEQSLLNFPVVSIIGSRQCGKTTLAKVIADSIQKPTLYLDMERPSDHAKLQEAELYLEELTGKLVILDEIQRKPDLFPLLRSIVDNNPEKKGRYLILGSASPSLVRQSSESLAGRIIYHELSPFSLKEVETKDIYNFWLRGGYPLSYLANSDENSIFWREAFIQTFLERDIPQLGIRIPAIQIRRFWEMISHCHGQLWNASKIAGSLGVSAPASRRYLDILQDTFMVRQLQPYHPNLKKRLVKSPKLYIRDSGILHILLRIFNKELLLSNPNAGSSFEGFVIEQVSSILPDSIPLYFYRTNAGAEVDLVLLPPGSPPVAIEIKFTKSPKISKGFRQSFNDLGCNKGFIVAAVTEGYPISKNIEVIPVHKLASIIDYCTNESSDF